MLDDGHSDFGFLLQPSAGSSAADQSTDAANGIAASVVVPDGTIIEATGSTVLVQVGNNYYVHPVGDPNGVQLSAFGAPVFTGQFGPFVPIAAEALGGGYQVAWKAMGLDQYTVLNADSDGVFQSHAFFVVTGGSYALESIEPNLQQDLNGDQTIGLVTHTMETSGSTTLAKVADTYFLYTHGTATGPQLSYSGTPVTAGRFGDWTPLGVEAVSGGGYRVVWQLGGTDEYTVWNVDSGGNYISNAAGFVTAASYAIQSLEQSFGQDLNHDTHIGPTTATVEAQGATTLDQVADAYFLYATGGTTGPQLTYNGAAVTPGLFGAWTPLGSEADSGGGYHVVWQFGGTDEYTVWNVDGGGHFTSNTTGFVTAASYAIQSLETDFNQDLNHDGHVGPTTATVEAQGATTLDQVADSYFLYASGGTTGPQLSYNGVAVTAGLFGAWTPTGVEAAGGGGYHVVWQVAGTDQYTVWDVDAGGHFTSNTTGFVTSASYAIQSLEAGFNQDLNHDGTIGAITSAVDTSGVTYLTHVADTYFLYDAGTTTGPQLKYGGTGVTPDEFGTWTPVGAEAVGGGYEVVWQVAGTDQYTVWNVDSGGNFTSNTTGLVAGGSYALESLEASFHQDLNHGGQVGIAATQVVEQQGATTLEHVADTYFLYDAGTTTGPQLKYSGTGITQGEFGTWAPIGAEAVSGGGYEVVWQAAGTDQYLIWDVDSGGNFSSNTTGVVLESSYALQSLEASFNQDLNHDGTPGITTMQAVEAQGSTTLVHAADAYLLYATGTTTGPQLKYGGTAVTAGRFDGWIPIGAEAVSSGYEVVWQVAGTSQYTVWNVDGNGSFTSNTTGLVSGSSLPLASLEATFQQDLNHNGAVDSFTVIEGTGSTDLVRLGGDYYMTAHGTLIGWQLTYNGTAVTDGLFGSWRPVGVEATSDGYQLAWKNGNADQYLAWNVGANGAFRSNYAGVMTSSSWLFKALEANLQQDLNGDTLAGLPTGAYNIDINYTGDLGYKLFFDAAALRWEQVITGDVPDVYNAQFGYIDDLRIDANVSYIDGPGQILGYAGPDYVRSGSYIPTHGNMTFDSADLVSMANNGTLFSVVLHEIGHILGIGTVWSVLGLKGGYQYYGQYGLDAYRTLSGNPSASYVPLESGGGSGTAGSHWSEAVFGSELMTGYISGVPDPLSILTIASLRDIGYSVNMAQADAYTLPGHLTSDLLSATTTTGGSETSSVTAGLESDMAFIDEHELYA